MQEELNQKVSELIPGYGKNRAVSSVKSLAFKELLTNKLLLSGLIREGIPYALFMLIQRVTPFSESEWADLLNISIKSLRRYKEEARHLKPIQAEKVIEMAEVTELGMDVFGDMDKLKLWLDTPNFALGSYRPKDLIKDSYGKEMVVGELTRVNFGIFV